MNIYQTLYDLVNNYIFNGSVVANSNQELVTMLVATIGSIFIIALPFLVVWQVIRGITR